MEADGFIFHQTSNSWRTAKIEIVNVRCPLILEN